MASLNRVRPSFEIYAYQVSTGTTIGATGSIKGDEQTVQLALDGTVPVGLAELIDPKTGFGTVDPWGSANKVRSYCKTSFRPLAPQEMKKIVIQLTIPVDVDLSTKETQEKNFLWMHVVSKIGEMAKRFFPNLDEKASSFEVHSVRTAYQADLSGKVEKVRDLEPLADFNLPPTKLRKERKR